MLYFFISSVWASPAESIIRFRKMLGSDNNEKTPLPLPRPINPARKHVLAEALLERPSFLAMINRYVSGENVAKDVATQTKEMHAWKTKTSRWYWLKNGNETQFTMLALKKEEIYPVKDPFSKTRSKTLYDSIQVLRDDCSRFTSEVDGTLRRWIGQNCAYGNVWIEWEATREYPMYVLVQKKQKHP